MASNNRLSGLLNGRVTLGSINNAGWATGVSADGSVIVGSSSGEAFRWTASSGIVPLGALAGSASSEAKGVSADGSVVVGDSTTASGNQQAFRWTASGGMVSLGDLPGATNSVALAVSGNGQVIVGESGGEAFRWTVGGGMVPLGNLVGTDGTSSALATSYDGSVIVGQAGNEAMIWTATEGMINLKGFLVGLNPPPYTIPITPFPYSSNSVSGWALFEATGVSADGRTIVGNGGDGLESGFVATIPEPSSVVLATLAIAGLIVGMVRSRLRSVRQQRD